MRLCAVFAVLLGIFILIMKRWSNGPFCRNQNTLEAKIILITGGTSGIGLETAKDFASRGGKVYFTCRSLEAGELTATAVHVTNGLTIIPLQLNLESPESIHMLVAEFKQREKRLDILVNNAGVFYVNDTTAHGLDMTFAVNHLGHFLLTNLLMDELVASPAARIISVSSLFYYNVEANWDYVLKQELKTDLVEVYGKSKLANVLFTSELARRLQDKNIMAYSLHPGVIFTNILRTFLYESPIVDFVVAVVMWPLTKTLEAGAQTTIFCATEDAEKLVSGHFYNNCEDMPLNDVANSANNALELWNFSLQMLNLTSQDLHPYLNV